MTTAERIKTARKEAGMTQDELASKMFVTHHCISMWERGLRQPKYETLVRIANALGINVNRLLQTPMTNADRIRAMSDEELAEFLCSVYDDDHDKCIEGYTIPYYDQYQIGAWLKQPVKEDA